MRACEDASAVQPIFVLDPWFLSPERVGANRLRFLLESLRDLDDNLRSRGSSLLVLHGDPTRVVPAALEKWRCSRLCYETDTEPYALKRDAAVADAARALGAEVHTPVSHTLYDVERLLAKCPGGQPPPRTPAFSRSPPRSARPLPPPDAPETIPALAGDAAELVDALGDVVTGPRVPTLESLGYPPLEPSEGFPARGGETEGLRRLRATLARTTYVGEFKKPQTSPTALWGRRRIEGEALGSVPSVEKVGAGCVGVHGTLHHRALSVHEVRVRIPANLLPRAQGGAEWAGAQGKTQ